jgi:hypothetical protein
MCTWLGWLNNVSFINNILWDMVLHRPDCVSQYHGSCTGTVHTILILITFFSVRSCLEELFSKEYYSSKVLWAFLRATTVRCQLGLLYKEHRFYVSFEGREQLAQGCKQTWQCRESNPQPSDHGSKTLITRPRRPSFQDFKRAGISRLLEEKGREQFWPKKGNLRRTRKNLKNRHNSLLLGSIKCFP